MTPANPGDFFFYIRNTSQLRDLFVSRIQVSAATAETVIVQPVTGTVAGGTTVSPTNRNVGATLTFSGSVEQGATLTGLSSLGNYERLLVPAGGFDERNLIERPIYLPENSTSAAIALSAVTGAITLDVLIDVVIRSFDNEDVI